MLSIKFTRLAPLAEEEVSGCKAHDYGHEEPYIERHGHKHDQISHGHLKEVQKGLQ